MAQQHLLTDFQTSVSKSSTNLSLLRYHYPNLSDLIISVGCTSWLIGIHTMTPLQHQSTAVFLMVHLAGRDECHVAIRVSDRAGGIPSDVGDRIWLES